MGSGRNYDRTAQFHHPLDRVKYIMKEHLLTYSVSALSLCTSLYRLGGWVGGDETVQYVEYSLA